VPGWAASRKSDIQSQMAKNLLGKSRRLPPLTAVRAFEAAGRHGGIQAAAAELNVTATAVSQQVRLLEEWLERPLFERHSRGVTLTPLGASLWPEFEVILDQLDTVARQARTRPAATSRSASAPGWRRGCRPNCCAPAR
jgi:LysR family glycine cleavage system transcriptional activator